jgi:gluconokinase
MKERGIRPRFLVLMGVSGCGKSTVAPLVAERLGWAYVDGDWLHPAANVEKMRRGEPLTDEDRWPWLRAIAARIDAIRAEGGGAVVACSALKRAYREILAGGRGDTRFVFLTGAPETIARRLAARDAHFMPAALLESQLRTLEAPGPDEDAIVVSIEGPPAEVVETIVTSLPPSSPAPTSARTPC